MTHAHLLGLDEEAVVAVPRLDDRQHRPVVGGGDLLRQPQRVEPVGGHAGDVQRAGVPGQGGGQATATAADVVAVHRLGQHDVAVRVEASRELAAWWSR